MFIINDISLFNSFNKPQLLLHENIPYKVYNNLVPFSLKYETIQESDLPVLSVSSIRSRINHVRLNIKNRGIKAIVLVMDTFIDDWIQDFYDDGISLIIVESTKEDIMQDMLNDLNNYKQEIYSRVTNAESFLQNYTRSRLDYKEIIDFFKTDCGFEVMLLKSNNDVLSTTTSANHVVSNLVIKEQIVRIKNTISLFKMDASFNHSVIENGIWLRIPIIEQDYYQLIIFNNDPLRYIDILILERVANAIRFEALREVALESSEVKKMNEVFDNLLNGKHSSYEDLVNNAQLLGLQEKVRYRIITIGFLDSESSWLISDPVRFKIALDLTVEKLETIWPQFFFRQYSNRITLLVDDPTATDRQFKERLKPQLADIIKILSEYSIILKIGVSDMADIRDIHLKSIQSLQVIKISQLLKSDESIIFFDNLGIYKLFIKLQGNYNLLEIIPQVIFDIESFNPEYLETLIVFLEQNQNYSLTARTLYIHPKTVRYRIKKLVDDFNLNLDLPEVVMNLQMGIRAYDLEKSNIIL